MAQLQTNGLKGFKKLAKTTIHLSTHAKTRNYELLNKKQDCHRLDQIFDDYTVTLAILISDT